MDSALTFTESKIPLNMKRVLMLFPPFHENLYGEKWKRSESPFPPLGLNYLATPLIKAGYDVRIIDFQVDHLNRVQYFESFRNADYILISCFTFAHNIIQRIIGDIKTINEKAVIICGGPYCTETENHVENADFTVFGEADLVIVRLLDSIASGKIPEDIPGLCYRHDGIIKRNSGILRVENLDLIDIPLFDLSAGKDYGYVYGVKLEKIYPLVTTRGCPYDCSFCTFRNVKYRERSVENVFQEIKTRAANGAKYIVFCDDNFLLRPDRANEIFDRIILSKLNIRIVIQGRVDIIDYQLALKMKKANVKILIFGIESVNQDVLDFYHKRTTTEKIRQVIEIMNSVGIITISGLIIGAPDETNKHFERTIEFFDHTPQDFINVNILRYQKPSRLWIQANKKGVIGNDEVMVYANDRLSNFSYEELTIVQKRIIRSFYANPRRVARLVCKVPRNLGWLTLFKVLFVYLNKTIYRSSQEFHR